MKVLNNEEMIKVKGGALSAGLKALLGGAVVFLIGLIDGLMNPQKCN